MDVAQLSLPSLSRAYATAFALSGILLWSTFSAPGLYQINFFSWDLHYSR